MEPVFRLVPPAWMTAPETRTVLAALPAPARFVGGCVRDALLGRPVKDIDIATPEPPEVVLSWLERAGLRAIPTGLSHGTVTAVTGRQHFEITTLRRDVETYGRRAKVAFTDDWAADAARRDFTMNAMFADPDGTVYDPTGGLPDLSAGRVRFVGNAADRIEEDALRLLRFFRFHAHYGRGAPDPEAVAACAAAAPKLRSLSGERLAGETIRLLQADTSPAVLDLMALSGVLKEYLPEVSGRRRLERLILLERRQGECEPLRRLAALLPPESRAIAALAKRLRLSNAEKQRIAEAAVPPPEWPPADEPRAARRALYRLGSQRVRDLALLSWAVEPAEPTGRWQRLLDLAAAWERPRLPVGGADVMALGEPPGPRIRTLLAAVERWWEAGDFQADRAAALAELERLQRVDAEVR